MTWWRVPRDFVLVRGKDAKSFLQGQLSQDLDPLGPGDSAMSFILQPQGKVDAYVRVTRVGDDGFLLDVDPEFGDAVVTRLERFKLRTDAEIKRVGGWQVIASIDADGDLVEEIVDDIEIEGVAGDLAQYEAARIRAGMPAMGREIDESTIPAALGVIDRAVSFTKGCYTGQELVARIDSRGGSAPTKLVGVRGDTEPGAAVVVDGKDVGRITSAAGGVALALVRRDVELPSPSSVGQLEALPLA
jgi:folate-binding protein YgfZ